MAAFDRQTRRAFLGRLAKGSSAAAVSWLAGPRPQPEASEPASSGPWQIGCFTRPWGRFDYRVALDAIAQAGFKYVGLMSTKPKDDAPWALVISVVTTVDEARRVGEETHKRGLKIPCAYGGGIPVNKSLQAGTDGLRTLIDNSAAAGAGTLLLGGTGKPSLEQRYYHAITRCCDYAAEKGVALAIKPHGPLNATGPACRRVIESVGHPNFRLWYDPGNIYAYSDGKLDPVDDVATVDGLVAGLCVKDFTSADRVQITPGTGWVDFPAVLARLRQGGFGSGPLLIETLAPGDPDALLKEAGRAREFVQRLLE